MNPTNCFSSLNWTVVGKGEEFQVFSFQFSVLKKVGSCVWKMRTPEGGGTGLPRGARDSFWKGCFSHRLKPMVNEKFCGRRAV
jgi:hypothetical protein